VFEIVHKSIKKRAKAQRERRGDKMVEATATKKGYRIKLEKPNDDQITDRDRFGRWAWLIVCSVIIFAFPTWLLWYWASFINPVIGFIGGLLGFGVGGYIASKLIPDRFLTDNKEWTAFVTQDMFGGGMVPYGPGLHPSYFWEERSKEGNYPLTVITRPFSVSIATKTSEVTVKGEYEYAMSLRRITLAIGVDESTIDEGITAFIESFLTNICADKDAEWVRGHINDLNEALAVEFMEREGGGEDPTSFEARFGFVTVSIVISNILLPKAVQKTRDAKDEATQLFEVVAQMYGIESAELKRRLKDKEISTDDYNKMLNRAMAVSDNATTMSINVIEGDAGAALAGAATRLAKGGKS